jgi:hypothetical protein
MHISCSINFFPENFVFYEIMCRNTLEPEIPQITVWRMRLAYWITKGHRHALRKCSTNCFPTTTMVARTCVYFTSQVHCFDVITSLVSIEYGVYGCES